MSNEITEALILRAVEAVKPLEALTEIPALKEMADDPPAQTELLRAARNVYVLFRVEGFTRDEALALTAHFIGPVFEKAKQLAEEKVRAGFEERIAKMRLPPERVAELRAQFERDVIRGGTP